MRVGSAGPLGVRDAGQVYDVPDAEAQQLIEGGYASVAAEAPKAEPESAGWGDPARIAEIEAELEAKNARIAELEAALTKAGTGEQATAAPQRRGR
jgi:hypothetical protein